MFHIRNSLRASVLGITAALVAGALPLAAQEPAAGKPGAPVAARPFDPSRRVPPFFGQLGLTPEQREEIYKVRAKHQEKIDSLKKQMAQAQAEMLAECETVLNDAQKALLVARREASSVKTKRAARAATPAAPRPEGSASAR